jgi:predicted deacylase
MPTTITTTASGIEIIQRAEPLRADGLLRHTVIVAGQHGCERGPVLGLLAHGAFDLTDFVRSGLLTIVRCANPHGFARWRREGEDGRDPNRQWRSVAELTGAQAEIWAAVVAAEQAYTGDRAVERVVLDLHSSSPDTLARTVCRSGDRDLALAVGAAVALSESAHSSVFDDQWRVLAMHEACAAASAELGRELTSRGSLGDFAAANGGVGLTIEFPEWTYDVSPGTLGPLERSIGREIPVPYPGPGRERRRQLTLNEATAGVAALVRWVSDTRHA